MTTPKRHAASEPRPFSEAARARSMTAEAIARAWAEDRANRVRAAISMSVERYPHSDCHRCRPDDPYCPADVELIEKDRERRGD